MNILDQLIGYLSPQAGANRLRNRHIIKAYDATKPSRLRKMKISNASGDALMQGAGVSLRGQARYLEQNYDFARTILNVLVARVIGPNGIGIEPMPMKMDGTIHKEFAGELEAAFENWAEFPETTAEHDWVRTQQLAGRSLFRDGEFFAQMLEGSIAGLNHLTRVPFSIELLEADFVPYDKNNLNLGITQGIERDAWGRPRGYHVFYDHPGGNTYQSRSRTKRIPASNMLHPKLADRFRQARGVSIFASVLERLEDIKEYESTERIAAKVAAAMTAVITKGQPEQYEPREGDDEERIIKMSSGMIYDGMREGEGVETIQSNRPSGLLTPFLGQMHKMVAGGTQTSYSSVSKNYDGNYSAQRQELVEQYINDMVLSGWFISKFPRPIYKRCSMMAILSGVVKVPDDIDKNTIYDAEYYPPPMIWIDPDREAKGIERKIQAGLQSQTSAIRSSGGSSRRILGEIETERIHNKDKGLVFSSDYANVIFKPRSGTQIDRDNAVNTSSETDEDNKDGE